MSRRLKRMLASRNADPVLAEDIAQEVAVRALDKRVPFTDPDDLYRWAATTARRLHIDHLRADCRTTCDDELVTRADGTDVAHTAERRVALDTVIRALAVMRPRERDAILESLDERSARSSQALVRRHRARATLRKAVGGVLTALVGARLRLRELAPVMQDVAVAAALAPALAVGAAVFVAEPAPQRVTERAPVTVVRPVSAREAVHRETPASVPGPVKTPRPAPAPTTPARATGPGAARPDAPPAPAPEASGLPVKVGEGERPEGKDGLVVCFGPTADPICAPDVEPRPKPVDPGL